MGKPKPKYKRWTKKMLSAARRKSKLGRPCRVQAEVGPSDHEMDTMEGSDDDSPSVPVSMYPGLHIVDEGDLEALMACEDEQSDSDSVDLFPSTYSIQSRVSMDTLQCSSQRCLTPEPSRNMDSLSNTPTPLTTETRKEMCERLMKRDTTKDGRILDGRRIITISSFEKSMRAAMEHGKTCKHDGVLQLVKDMPHGLKSDISFECIGCSWMYTASTDDNKNTTLPVNEALAWGTVAGGLTYAGVEHLFNVLEIPFPVFKTYQANEKKTLEAWETALMRDIEINGKEEVRLAAANGDFVEVNGVKYPFTTVEVDAAWNSRSYGHSFKSKGGVAAIIGKWTNKLLFLGVKNRFCYICKRNAGKTVVPEHKCYKNYDSNKSATSMEAAMILEGFNCSIDVHNLVYKRMIGDGDSSVYLTVLHEAKYPGIQIEKVECVNHAVKRFNSKLYLLSANTQIPLVERKTLKKEINRFGKALRGAIEYNNENNITNPNLLRSDIINIPFHIFGQHDKCRDYFCKEERKNEVNRVPLFKFQKSWQEITSIVLRAANLADRLIHNMKSNAAESLMSRVAKFNCGKRVNFTHRSGWNLRTAAAGLSYDKGPNFYAEAFKLSSGKSPQIAWRLQERRGIRQKEMTQACEKKKIKRTKLYFGETDTKKSQNTKRSSVHNTDGDYGPNAKYPDIDDVLLKRSIDELIDRKQVTLEQRDKIAKQTIGQSASEQWKVERSHRITASIAGKIFSMRDSTNNTSTLNTIIRPCSLSNIASLEHGRLNEVHGRAAYTKLTSNIVTDCGIYISLENGIFAASPDGLVGEDGIIEIKCPSSMIGVDPKNMPQVMKSCYLRPKRKKNDGLELSTKHAYYYQVVMQLYCTGRKWCDFVVYTYAEEGEERVDFEPFIQRITRSEATDKLWEEMKTKMEKFYREDLAPEIVDSRHERNMLYRQPKYRADAMDKAAEMKLKKVKVVNPAQADDTLQTPPQTDC